MSLPATLHPAFRGLPCPEGWCLFKVATRYCAVQPPRDLTCECGSAPGATCLLGVRRPTTTFSWSQCSNFEGNRFEKGRPVCPPAHLVALPDVAGRTRMPRNLDRLPLVRLITKSSSCRCRRNKLRYHSKEARGQCRDGGQAWQGPSRCNVRSTWLAIKSALWGRLWSYHQSLSEETSGNGKLPGTSVINKVVGIFRQVSYVLYDFNLRLGRPAIFTARPCRHKHTTPTIALCYLAHVHLLISSACHILLGIAGSLSRG